jgi:hypothetical protein
MQLERSFMDIIDAMIALQISPFDSYDGLDRAYRAHPGTHEAYRSIHVFLRSGKKLSDCINTSRDLNRLLQGFDHTKYLDIFQSIEARIGDIITSKGETKHGLVAVLKGLDPVEKLTRAVTIIRNILPNFDVFAEEQINPNPKPLTFWSVKDIKYIGERALQRKFPEGERVTATLFPQKMARRLNDSSSWIKGLAPIHTALHSGLIANQVQKALTSSTSLHSKEQSVALTSALAQQNLNQIRSSYDALIEKTENSFSQINYKRTATSLMYTAATFFSFGFATNALLTDYTLIAARLSAAAFVLNELYTNRYFLLSLTQKQSLDSKREDLIKTLSHMEAEFLTPLNRALELELSPDELQDPELVKGKLEEYNRQAARPVVIEDNGWCDIADNVNSSDAAEPAGSETDDDLCAWPDEDDNADDSPRSRDSESPLGF